MQPNLIAHLALLAFLPVAMVLFNRLPRATAAAAAVLAGSLLLPEQLAYNPPAIPPLDKESITYLSVLAAALFRSRGALSAARPGRGLELLVLLVILANVGTVFANPAPLFDEGRLEPGMGIHDVISMGSQALLSFALPFFLGRALFRTREDLHVLLVMMAGAGLVYAGLIVVEVVLSIPFHVFQLSYVLYGFSSGVSHRWGVIQPVVFMDHGLAVATWMASSVLAAAGLAKARLRVFAFGAKPSTGIIMAGLVMCRNVAGVVYGSTLTLAIAFLRPRAVANVSLGLALLVCTYPALRTAGLFPSKQIIDLAERFDEERARSLEGRFDEEEYVLNLMGDRVWFGWGTISRVPGAEGLGGWQAGGYEGGLDGFWVIELGVHGAVGMELRLAMLVLPVVVAWRRQRKLGSAREAVLLAALMAIVAMRAVDLLPNGWWNDLPVFLAGALHGLSGADLRASSRSRPPGTRGAGSGDRADSLRQLVGSERGKGALTGLLGSRRGGAGR